MEMIDSYLTVGFLSLFGLLSLISPDPNEQNVHNNTTYKVSIEHFFGFCSSQFSVVLSDAVDLFWFEFHGAAGCDWSRASRKNNSEP